MRLPLYTLFLSLSSLFSLVHSIHPYALSHPAQSPPPNALASRQHRVTRDLLDICINVNVDLLANLTPILGGVLGPVDTGAKIQLCLCLKDLNLYLETNDQIQALVGLLGKDAVAALITALINTSPDSKQCTFPPHAHHTCNNSDPCHYECDTNYVREGDICVCALPNTSCNGVCGSFPHGCGSAIPQSKRMELVRTLPQAQAICKPHETVCGIPGRSSGFVFECIDVSKTKDSCGGCVVPHRFAGAEPAAGKDCGDIPNVKNSVCSAKQCVVRSCKDGWVPSADKKECVQLSNGSSRMLRVKKRLIPSDANDITEILSDLILSKRNDLADVYTDTTINSDLLANIRALVDLVINLRLYTLSLPASSTTGTLPLLSGSTSALNVNDLVNSILTATANLLGSPTSSSLISYIDELVRVTEGAYTALKQSGYIDDYGLGPLVVDLERIIAAALGAQSFCHEHPVVDPPNPSLPDATPAAGSDLPIVLGLSDLLTSLGLLGPVNAAVTIAGLGPGINQPVNNILNGLGIGPANAKRSSDGGQAATINTELKNRLEGLTDLVLRLEDSMSSLPDSGSDSNPLSNQSVLNLARALGKLLQSKTVSTLLSNIDVFIAAEVDLQTQFTSCACIEALQLNDASNLLQLIDGAAVDLKAWCGTHSLVNPTPANPTPTLGPLLPTGAGPMAKVPAVSATSYIAIPSAIPNASGPSRDAPIIIGLDHLLASLGLGSGVIVVDGLLGNDLDDTVNGLDNGLGIGPDGLRRRGLVMVKRQIIVNADVDSDLLVQIDALVDSILALNRAATSLPPATPAPPLGSVTSIDHGLIDNILSSVVALLSSKTYTDLVDETDALLLASNSSLAALEGCGCIDDLGLNSLYVYLLHVVDAVLGLQDWCYSHPAPPYNFPPSNGPPPSPGFPSTPLPTPTFSSTGVPSNDTISSGGDEPLVVGLTKLLHGLGLDITADVVVDGLLGNGLDHSLNNILNGLGIGPNGARKRSLVRRHV